MNENDTMSKRDISLKVISDLHIRPSRRITSYTKDIQCSCPFHKDTKPSLGINLDKGIYHCFSCNRSGSITGLYYDITGNSFYKVYNISTDSFSSFARKDYSINYSDSNANIGKKTVYLNYDKSKLLPIEGNRLCMTYLHKRGIPMDIAKKYEFSYAKDLQINTTRFVNRICIPVYEDGQLTSIEGRMLTQPVNDTDRKVIYPKNTSVSTLFDIDNLNFNEDIYACEGLMDLFVLKTCSFFDNSTSIFGASLSNRQISLIARCNKRFIYIPDSDEAGFKTVEQLKRCGLPNIYILPLPEEVNGIAIKDVGDLPKCNSSPNDLLGKKWLNRIKPVNSICKEDIVHQNNTLQL